MININAVKNIISAYKQDFDRIHKEEIYKWKAVKCFQDNWDENAADFPAMLGRALEKAQNLLTSRNYFPKGMICELANSDAKAVKAMFMALYNELSPVTDRIENFIKDAKELRLKYGAGSWDNDYQDANAVSIYLFFKYPNKYFMYKYHKFKAFAAKIGYSDAPKKGKIEKVENYFDMCNEILDIVKQDNELLNISKKRLTEEDYPDNDFHILTDDIVYFGSKIDEETIDISEEQGTDTLNNPSVVKKSQISPSQINYWWLNANPKIWRFSDIRVGDEVEYTLLNENGNKRKIFQNFLDARKDDLVIGYESTPVRQIVSLCRVAGENDGEALYIQKVEELSTPIEYNAIKDIPELKNMEYLVNQQGSLFKLKKDEYELLLEIIRECNPSSVSKPEQKKVYIKENFLQDVYLMDTQYDSLCSLLLNKKNIILQGPPGVGKTFAAKLLAYSILGREDDDKVKIVQFHQNYSYEDFIMGYKPDESGFKLHTGIFYQFCKQAENYPKEKFFLIIDEINRGNLSKIFGELLMMIEKDYRGVKMTMAYTGLSFSVPENIYIIGMMNTADRSLAMIDYALRRRFSFYPMRPAFDNPNFILYLQSLNDKTLNNLIEVVKELNQDIANDASLGESFCIGHSYFHKPKESTDKWVSEIIYYDLIPMLKEYWFDDKLKVEGWTKKLEAVLND